MKKYLAVSTILSFLLVFMVSCSSSDDKNKSFNDFYNKNHYKQISKIELTRRRKEFASISISEKKKIEEILKNLENITFKKRKNQDEIQGGFDAVTIYENNELKFSISIQPTIAIISGINKDPSAPVHNTYYDINKDITEFLDKVIESEQKKG